MIAPTYNLDVAGAQQLEAELAVVEPDADELVVDLAAVAFVASSGLRVLLKHAQRLDTAGCALVLENANGTVREVLSMSGFDQIISVR
jgi:anti-anti-sigma factor